ncbi:MAG TPA: NAD(P)-dependent oxidoreductase [Atribacteraceae bacterium]|nr:NAD(P)-dependent oxidoreductase [Atribacteraceae bacterium]
MENLGELLREADYVFLCLPLQPETDRMIGYREFRAMRRGAYLINPSRGGVDQVGRLWTRPLARGCWEEWR